MRLRYHTGFSLIELLVVMLIVAVIAAGVSLAVNPRGSSAKQINLQGERLFAQMLYAFDEALVRNQAVGLAIEQDENDLQVSREYAWKRDGGVDRDTKDRHWLKTENPLGNHELAEEFAWAIEIEEVSLEENLDQLLNEDDDEIDPRIIFYPSGEVSEFSITITLSEEALQDDPEAINERYKITLNERGELTRYRVGVEEE